MNKNLLKAAKEMLEAQYDAYAKNFIVKEYQSQFDTPQAKKEVGSAELEINNAIKRAEWLKVFIKSLSKK